MEKYWTFLLDISKKINENANLQKVFIPLMFFLMGPFSFSPFHLQDWTEQDSFTAVLDVAQQILSPSRLRQLNMSLSIRLFSPRVGMHQQVFFFSFFWKFSDEWLFKGVRTIVGYFKFIARKC